MPQPLTFTLVLEGAGFAGDATVNRHTGIQVTDWYVKNMRQDGDAARFGALHISFGSKAGLAAFLDALAKGAAIDSATLYGTESGGAADLFRLELGNVRVAEVDDGIGGYSVTLIYGTIGEEERQRKSDGTLSAWDSFGYDTLHDHTDRLPDESRNQVALTGTIAPTDFSAVFTVTGGSNPVLLAPDGRVASAAHPGSVDVAAYSVVFANSVARADTSFVPGSVSVDNVLVTLANTDLATQLQSYLATGRSLANVTLFGEQRTANGTVTNYTLQLTTAFVSGLSFNGDGTVTVALTALNYALDTQPYDTNGRSGAVQSFAIDSGGTGLDHIDDRLVSVAAPDPDQSYTLVVTPPGGTPNGFAGTEKVNNQTGLHVVDWHFDSDRDFMASPGGGSGSPNDPSAADFAPIELTISGHEGMASFLQAYAAGTHLSAVTLFGASPNLTNPTLQNVASRLLLGDVTVTAIHDTGNDSYAVQLSYTRIGMEDRAQNPDGTYSVKGTFGWDQARDSMASLPAVATNSGGLSTPILIDNLFVTFADFVPTVDSFSNQAPDHAVDVLGYALSVTTAADGSSEIGDLVLTIRGNQLLTSLQDALARGTTLSQLSLTATGNRGSGTPTTTLVQIDETRAHVDRLVINDDGTYTVALSGMLRIRTWNLNSQGAPVLAGDASFQTNTTAIPSIAAGSGDTYQHTAVIVLDSTAALPFAGDQPSNGHIGFQVVDWDAGSHIATAPMSHPDFDSIGVTLHGQAGMVSFLKAMATGATISGATLYDTRTSNNVTTDVTRIRLGDVQVASVTAGDGDSYHVELLYRRIGEDVRDVRANGTLTPFAGFGWDVVAGRATNEPPLVDDTASRTSYTAGRPTSYVATFGTLTPDGVAASSLHARSIGVDGFTILALGHLPSDPSDRATAAVDGVQIVLTNPDLLTELQTALATGSDLGTVTLFGDQSIEGNRLTTYQLDIAHAEVRAVATGRNGTVTVTIAGDSYTIETWNVTNTRLSGGQIVTLGVPAHVAPDGTDRTVGLTEDTDVALSLASFGFVDSDNDHFTSVILTSLPGAGTLTLNGAAVAAGAVISATDIKNGLLLFMPDANGNGSNYASLTFQVHDDGGAVNGSPDTDPTPNRLTFNVAAVDDISTLGADRGSVNADATVLLYVLDNDSDVDGPAPTVARIAGTAIAAGGSVTLASGAVVTRNANGTIGYDPHHAFDYLVSNASDPARTKAVDSFTYANADGATATVTVTIYGVNVELRGTTGDDDMSGTPQADFFNLSQGGKDKVTGQGGDDGFYMGAALSTGDDIDGGTGNDQLAVQGNYAGLTLGIRNLTNVETLAILSGSDARFGDTANNRYSYNLTSVDANVAAGQTLTVSSNGLLAGEKLAFNGAAETDGKFLFYAGMGDDSLTGGQQSDGFFFGEGGRFTTADHVDGQGGTDDQLALRGDYSARITFLDTTMVNIETLVFLSSSGAANPSGPYSYNVVLADANVGAGKQLTVTGNTLLATESMRVDGSAETNGNFKFIGGAGNDTFIGGAGNDLFYGRGGQDVMTGGGGNDAFFFYATSESTTNAATMDRITDFATGDKIDLTTIDANTTLAGDQAFTFLGQNVAFTGHAGELHVVSSGGNWIVEVDVNGDGVADMGVLVTSPGHTWIASDFAL